MRVLTSDDNTGIKAEVRDPPKLDFIVQKRNFVTSS